MINITDKPECCGCNACYNICPQECITMMADVEGFWYPMINIEECTKCGLCDKVCPILCRETVQNNSVAYACINKDNNIKQQSSSGAVFSLIAEKVLGNDGIVFGAVFDTDFNVEHSWTDSIDELSRFRGSKYVQSNIGNTYKKVRTLLKQGRQVLFSGTPCQIAGLKTYLDKDYESLICVDIICHGVPSPKVWWLYKQHMEKVFGAKTARIAFRDKNFGWRLYSVSFTFDNGTEYSKPLTEDIFMQGFLKDIYLRPSCHDCRFKSLNRLSDITLADFWGIEGILPQMDDDQGTSLVLVHSAKGQAIFSSIAERMIYERVDIDKAIAANPAAIKSAALNPKREKFFAELVVSDDINQLIIKYTRVSFPRKVYAKARGLASRLKRKIITLKSL